LLRLNILKHYSIPQICHSDQGLEHRGKKYLNLLKSFDIKPFMTKKAILGGTETKNLFIGL